MKRFCKGFGGQKALPVMLGKWTFSQKALKKDGDLGRNETLGLFFQQSGAVAYVLIILSSLLTEAALEAEGYKHWVELVQ